MSKITTSKYGIHFQNNTGQVNAHWRDLLGIGLNKSISFHILKSMRRFWSQVLQGVNFLISGNILNSIK